MIVAIALSVSAPGDAAEKRAKQTAASPPVAVEVPWRPEPFDITRDSLRPGEDGLDTQKLYFTFHQRVAAAAKTEFETTEEFRARTGDIAALLAPIRPSELYALKINGLPFRYDADAEVFTVGGIGEDSTYYTCKESREPRGIVLCPIVELVSKADSYVGTNAYGASRTVDRVRTLRLAIAMPSDAPLIGSVLSHGSLIFTDKIAVPLARAKRLKDAGLSVLAVGVVTEAIEVQGHGEVTKPTIGNPRDAVVAVRGIPFAVRRLVYYAAQTGEILGVKDFAAP